MFIRPWDTFFTEEIRALLDASRTVIDIGGSLRIATDRSSRGNPAHTWIREHIRARGIVYKILDYVDTYHPDIVGDIQHLAFKDDSQEAIIAIAVLEHVEEPWLAAKELYRVLAPGGHCFIYVPFLYYYHAERGYYKDYWRFSRDIVELLFKPFSSIKIMPVRGAFETWIRLSPLGRFRFFADVAFIVDRLSGKSRSKQVSGYYVSLIK